MGGEGCDAQGKRALCTCRPLDRLMYPLRCPSHRDLEINDLSGSLPSQLGEITPLHKLCANAAPHTCLYKPWQDRGRCGRGAATR